MTVHKVHDPIITFSVGVSTSLDWPSNFCVGDENRLEITFLLIFSSIDVNCIAFDRRVVLSEMENRTNLHSK